MKGVVRKWNPERRFGFVRADDGRVCFLHLGEIVGNIQPQIGARLEFDVEEGPQGLVAVNVSSTGRDASPVLATTHRGTVTHFHAARGFGNIRPNEGNVLQSIFFHARQVQYRDIAAGDLVEFDVGHDLRGRPVAINVRRIAPGQSQRKHGDRNGISPDDGGRDLFVHYTGIEGTGYRTLNEDQKVEYEATEGRKGPQAVNVRVAV